MQFECRVLFLEQGRHCCQILPMLIHTLSTQSSLKQVFMLPSGNLKAWRSLRQTFPGTLEFSFPHDKVFRGWQLVPLILGKVAVVMFVTQRRVCEQKHSWTEEFVFPLTHVLVTFMPLYNQAKLWNVKCHLLLGFSLMGLPSQIKTDNGPAYISIFKLSFNSSILNMWGIPYNPTG